MFRRGLEGSALRFSYQDGVVDHVCAGNREEPWTLNIKKGILSAFQNSMDDLSKSQNITEVLARIIVCVNINLGRTEDWLGR